MPAKVLNSNFIKSGLTCPEHMSHIEYTDKDRTGLYVEVRSTSPWPRNVLVAFQG